jgi:ferrochelatase
MSSSHLGVLLVNLGSPDSPSVRDVRRYLAEFLMDPRVIDLAWPLRTLIVRGFILPFRPKQSAEAYEKIWTPAGAPLVLTSRAVQAELERVLEMPVELAMRYRLPTPAEALRNLLARGVTEAALVPLFPHYAMSSFETAVVHVQQTRARVAPSLNLRVAKPYFEDPAYLRALAASVAAPLAQPYDHLLLSFHGIPERHLRKSDPTGCHCLAHADCCDTPGPALPTCYRAQCFRTAAGLARLARPKAWSVAFQSRLGRDPWLKPYTDEEIRRLAGAGVRRLLVLCPAFVADCLETIEEIGLRGKETFREAGGEELTLIPCLNERPEWIEALADISRRTLGERA